MMKFRKFLFTALFATVLCFGSSAIYAQPGGQPPGPGGNAPCDSPPCGPPGNPDPPGRVPIGGIELLLAAGAALGAGRIAYKRNANQAK